MWYRIVLFLFFANALAREQQLESPHLDFVLQGLSNQKWDEDELTCRNKIFNLLENVKNSTLWASWAWDSNPMSPMGIFFGARRHYGNYDQCLYPPWQSSNPELRQQYCLAEVEMAKGQAKNLDPPGPYQETEKYYLEHGTKVGRSFSYMSYGVCLPAGCPNKSVEKFVRSLLNASILSAAKDAEVSIHHCEESGVVPVPSTGYYVYLYTIAALLFAAVASTYYISEYPMLANQDTFANHVAKSFCLRRNWVTVFKDDKDALTSLHGIRFLTAVIIVYIHQSAFMQGATVSNALYFEKMFANIASGLTIVHFDLYVDTFFAMSALLLGKSLPTLDLMKPYNLVKSILKRYIRLIGPFAVTVFYMAHVSIHTGNGPLFPKDAKFEQQACEKNWWLALLMVGNYFNTLEMCHPATWYIPCDFHFYVITLVLLYVYRKNPSLGKMATAVVLFFGFLGPAISTYIYDLPAVMTYNVGTEINIRNNKNFNFGYIRTHNRMGPYVAGLLAGYGMSLYKPADYKRVWSKTTSFLGASASLGLMGIILALGVLCFQYSVHGILACIFMIVNRTTFAIAVLGVIVFCTYGDVPLINSLLSWPVFAPLSRLSYGLYVIHLLLLYRSKLSVRSYLSVNRLDSVTESFGLAVISLMLSMTVWLLVEAPLINFTNRYLNTKSETKEKLDAKRNSATTNGVTDKQKAM